MGDSDNITKVEALIRLLETNNGVASWDIIYAEIEKYYPQIKHPDDWKAALRGVLYREIKEGRNFERVGLGTFALIGEGTTYDETEKVELIAQDKEPDVSIHSFIEGICVEMGNLSGYDTYTADPNRKYGKDAFLKDLASIGPFPAFTYEDIIKIARRIDVIWFTTGEYKFPKKAIEVVDTPGTLGTALNRMYQLSDFNIDFFIIGENEAKFKSEMRLKPYVDMSDRFVFKTYDGLLKAHKTAIEQKEMSVF